MENVQQSLRGWPPRLVVAAPQGHSGKTTVSLGICAAMRERGLVVQPFKKGPDYIDPSWLTAAAGRPCRNLDNVLMPGDRLIGVFERGCKGADVAIIEGAMGLYDGLEPGMGCSTGDVARLLASPVSRIFRKALGQEPFAHAYGDSDWT